MMAIKKRDNRKKSSRPRRQRTYKVVCAGCNKVVSLEVPPPNGKTLFCLDCYNK